MLSYEESFLLDQEFIVEYNIIIEQKAVFEVWKSLHLVRFNFCTREM